MTEAVEHYKSKPSSAVSGSFAAPSAADQAIAEEKKRRATDVSYRLMAARQELLDGGSGLTDANIRELVLETYDVRDTVIEVAQKYNVDTVVVGSRGHGAVKRAVLGSLSSYLVHSFDGNVVVCRGDVTTENKQ
jgi:nucleotide-binding universal stress UspA family protein